MGAGELELRKAFEETTTRNVQMCIDYSNETRKNVRKLEINIKSLQNTVISRNEDIGLMKKQIAVLLQEKYKNGS